MRSRGNFHNVEDSTQRICVTVENFESSSIVQGTEGGAKYNCNYCQKDITGKIRIKCAVCLNFDLCVECMSAGAEINTHKCDHAYRVMEICQELLVPLHSLTSRKPRMLCLPRIELSSGLSLRTMSKFWGPLPRTPSARQFVKIEHTSSSTFKKPKNFRDSHTISTAISRQYVFSSGLLQGFLANLNTKVFPLDKMSLGEAESSNALLHLQGDLLRVMSYLHHVGEKTAIEGSAANQKLIEDLTRQCQQEKDKALALEKEVKRLKGNVEQDGMLARADISSLQREKDQLHEEVVQLKIAAETFPKEMEMAVNGAKIVARWELMREWLKQQTNSWKPAAEFRQYRIFMETEAELKNIPPPFSHDEPEIPDESLDQGDDAYMEVDPTAKTNNPPA
ncbi:hypothetical protein DY000_02038952 [Brassica cretica]|uniref:ZZ-type domain-containing protein n=1 Tax=Brassica cretica TaxID=69181 RepID=A0ABQ7BCS9_BRACR|nr:hypothetical protein DY000_02038952 [Brassica cretica]